MWTARLRERTPSAKPVGARWLSGYRLEWDKISADGSRKCDARRTDGPNDTVWGVLYEIAAEEEQLLDQAEGLGAGYEKSWVSVGGLSGVVNASIYVATSKRADDLPYDWYKAYVVAGAKEHGLPAEYVQSLESVAVKKDPDWNRAHRHLCRLGQL